jgi:hypothetical protein
MITLRHSLTKLLSAAIIVFSASSTVCAEDVCPSSHDVLKRKGQNGYQFVKAKLNDLYCGKGFEGKYFKIVNQKDNHAINFQDDPELVKRAANVYHHLTVARNFWIDEIKSDFVKSMPQITIRLQITNGFSRVGHYQNDDLEVNNNNAWTIPAGSTPRWAEHQEVWGQEIWFSPMKKIESRTLVTSSGNNPLTDSLVMVKEPVLNFVEGNLTQSMLNTLFYPTYQSTTLLNSVLIHVGAIGAMYGVIEISKKMDKLFMDKYFYIDTAMIPEIIYHEFSHIALSDNLQPIHSVAVIEGMADYFATRIANTEKMYRSIKDFSANAHKNAKNKKHYHPHMEHENNAQSDFTLGFLWSIKGEIDKTNVKRLKEGRQELANADTLIYESRKNLTAESTILNLTQALRTTCANNSTICLNKRLGVGLLDKVIEKKGF